jgi:hypothetical protein
MAWDFGLLESPFCGGNETLRLLGIWNGKNCHLLRIRPQDGLAERQHGG